MLKRFFVAIALLCIYFSANAVDIQNVDPPFWWVGMKNTELQILLHGKDIAKSDVTVNYPGVNVKEVVRTTNPNYVFLYVDITSKAKPGKMNITFT
ncbi:MAG: cyclomaltodextrinase N-terminal domain-containing protein, partial [Bacteroidales bacterium]|nr:cyclomaltodextrinase N-terminal domain-containing protein [Bacteroidales bacterium]